MKKLIDKITDGESSFWGIAFFVSIFFLGVPLILEENSKWVHDFFERYPNTLYFFFVPFGLYILGAAILLISAGFVDLLEYYHKLRSKGLSVDKAFLG